MGNRSVTRSAASMFSALGDPTRCALLDLLRGGRLPAGQIAAAFPVSRPAISRHLRVLRRAHLVVEHRQGRHRLYELNAEPLAAIDSWLNRYRSFWRTQGSSLKAFVESEYRKAGLASNSGKSHREKDGSQ